MKTERQDLIHIAVISGSTSAFGPRTVTFTLLTTDRQTTDGRAIAYSEREREFTFAKNGVALVRI